MIELKLGDRVLAIMDPAVAESLLRLFDEPGMFMSAEVGRADRIFLGSDTDENGPFNVYDPNVEVPVTINLRARFFQDRVIRRL